MDEADESRDEAAMDLDNDDYVSSLIDWEEDGGESPSPSPVAGAAPQRAVETPMKQSEQAPAQSAMMAVTGQHHHQVGGFGSLPFGAITVQANSMNPADIGGHANQHYSLQQPQQQQQVAALAGSTAAPTPGAAVAQTTTVGLQTTTPSASVGAGSKAGAAVAIGQNNTVAAPSATASLPAAAAAAAAQTLKVNGFAQHQLHPLAIQSSATCPPHVAGTLPVMNFNVAATAQPNGPGAATLSASFLPTMIYNPSILQQTALPPAPATAANTQRLLTLQATTGGSLRQLATTVTRAPATTANVVAASAQDNRSKLPPPTIVNVPTPTAAAPPTAAVRPAPASDPTASAAAATTQRHPNLNTAADNATCGAPAGVPAQMQRAVTAPVGAPTTAAATQATNAAAQPQQAKVPASNLPPFFLFDAPIELRTNFLASQRMHNLPALRDNNSMHYGMAVNGFHPQLNAQNNPILPLNTASSSGDAAGASTTQLGSMAAAAHLPASAVKLIDGRGKKPRTGRERNEREQKRAAKITELIEKLRTSMESGGWKVEMKSKYHTLSTCADYVKHLIETTKQKEELVEKAKADLEVKERALEEKALAESRSDPESVASTLTASTTESAAAKRQEEDEAELSRISQEAKASLEQDVADHRDQDVNRKQKTQQESSAGSNEESSSGDDHGSGPGMQNISLGKMSSSISDVTDSNRDSEGSGNNNSGRRARPKEGMGETNNIINESRTPADGGSSISSTAAVVRGNGSGGAEHGHADVVFKKVKRNRKKDAHKERTSLESNFVLDFEEVFLSSNVPQIIATPAGRIVSCNDFFLKATGISKEDVQRLTIFSIVKPDKLADLFQIVAEALREAPTAPQSETGSKSSGGDGSDRTAGHSGSSSDDATVQQQRTRRRRWDYAAITLPCISFPAKENPSTSHHPNPIYMTVTLMPDEDPNKRCFHCVLTDHAGTNGRMGFITPELLAKLFTSGDRKSKFPVESVETEDEQKMPQKKKRKVEETDGNDASGESNGVDDGLPSTVGAQAGNQD